MTRSVPNLAAVEALDDQEMIEGYWSGRDGDPEPGDNRSLAFWHGWRNGAVDFKHRQIDAEQMKIAGEFVAKGRAA